MASSLKAHPGEAHLPVGAVRWEFHGTQARRRRLDLLRRPPQGGRTVRIYVKPNRHFRLPDGRQPPDHHDRRRHGRGALSRLHRGARRGGARARAGCSSASATSPTTSSTSSNGRSALESGALSRIDVAFSRDQPEKIYVQQRLWEQRARPLRWLEDGAHIYVCGDEKGMARDVDVMLGRILARGRARRRRSGPRQAERARQGRPLPARRILMRRSQWPAPQDAAAMTDDKRAKNEIIKEKQPATARHHRRGAGRCRSPARIAEDDTQLIKFHGTYMQDDRDVRASAPRRSWRRRYSFMIRLRLPGGVVHARAVAGARRHRRHLRQQHAPPDDAPDVPVPRRHQVEPEARRCRRSTPRCSTPSRPAATSTATSCAAANPFLSKTHAAAHELARDVSEHLLPQTGAYHEIWLDGEKVDRTRRPGRRSGADLRRHYLPRKFKIVIAVPPDNDVDIFAHDLGFIAIVENGELVGCNVTIGGGMGMTHGEPDTFPRTADVLGFCTPEQAIDVAEKVVTVQRDWGNRRTASTPASSTRSSDAGSTAFRAEVETPPRLQARRAAPLQVHHRPATASAGSRAPTRSGTCTLFVENGRIKDMPGQTLAHGAARNRRDARRRLRRHGQPERHHRQRAAEGEGEDRGDPEGARHRHRDALSGTAPQLDGLRGAADLRAGAGRERALPAGADRRRWKTCSTRRVCATTTSSSA